MVALAGATGSGKSSLFNAVSGTDLAAVGVRRPTTSQAMAVTWGAKLPEDLLDWLEIPGGTCVPARRHRVSGTWLLLDLPDHDSTELTHRLDRRPARAAGRRADLGGRPAEVRRRRPARPLPQPLAGTRDGDDRRAEPERPAAAAELERCLGDLRRLLDSEGLRARPIMAMSATDGTGVHELREVLSRTVLDKRAMARRIAADVGTSSAELAAELGTVTPQFVSDTARRWWTALGEATGVPIVVDGVREAWKLRGGKATGWPFVTWVSKLKPDPLRALRLDQTKGELAPTTINRTSLPSASAVQRARLDRGLRELADAATIGLPRGLGRSRSATRPGAARRCCSIAWTPRSQEPIWNWTGAPCGGRSSGPCNGC